jgi:uncharacterized membrane protein (DUF485 family)
MQLTENSATKNNKYLAVSKSFLVWCFALAICLLVVGFPLVALMATVGALLSVALHPVLPMSAVLLVAGGILATNVFAVVTAAGMLTARGIHPEQVRWLSWLNGQSSALQHNTNYAACPLTCELKQ